MKPLLHKTTILCLAVAVLVGGSGCPSQTEAATMGAFSASPSNLSYLFSRGGGSLRQDVPKSLGGKEQVIGNPDSRGRTSGIEENGTGSLPFTYSPEAHLVHYFAFGRENLRVKGDHSELTPVLPLLVVIRQAYALGASANNSLNPDPEMINEPHWVVNSIKNSLARMSDLPTGGPFVDKGGTLPILTQGFKPIFLIGGMNKLEGPGYADDSTSWDGLTFLRKVLGLSPKTLGWSENPAPDPHTIFLWGAGLVGLIRYRMNRAWASGKNTTLHKKSLIV